jgi:UPF0271 protein
MTHGATTIDLNADMGEMPELVADGTEAVIMECLSSVNVACGAHAGDAATMQATVRAALDRRLSIGAHPGYPDPEHFGRRPLRLPLATVAASVAEQVARLDALLAREGGALTHVKPHGALYNQAAGDAALAEAIARGVADALGARAAGILLVGLAGSVALLAWEGLGFRVAPEGFVDRRYEADGTLRSRALPGALLTDPEEAAVQALSLARDRSVMAHGGARVAVEATTLCLHGDSPGAARCAAVVAARLRAGGISIVGPARARGGGGA